MRLLVIAGEASGDLHGAGVIKELNKKHKGIDIFGIGGDKMQNAGMNLVYHINELSVMGLWEVIKKLPTIRSVTKTLETVVKHKKPDAILLIDYPGFNLRFAEKAHQLGIKIFYYIAPQLWAWHAGRIKKIKKYVDKVFVVFSFEEDIYKKAGIDVEFVGHPLLDVLDEPLPKADFCKRYDFDKAEPIVGLFPGSRKQELLEIFPVMLNAAKMLSEEKNAQIAVGVASVFEGDFIRSFLNEKSNFKLMYNATYDLMKNCDAAIVTSGTATLETAYYQTPMVIVYKTSWLTYFVGRLLVKIKNIGLVNIVAGKKVIPELIQNNFTAKNIYREIKKYLENEKIKSETQKELLKIREKLGSKGAAERVADGIIKLIKK